MRDNKYTSHESFEHDSIDSLGYDWERIADPNIKSKLPFKIYLPRTTDHVVNAIKETSKLDQELRVRSKGHSSNDLVLNEDGAILCTEKLNQIINLDLEKMYIRVQSGIILADIDEYLAEYEVGLPIIGDHNHITAGGFASVGGISPASHRFGLFIDNVLAVEYVNWNGDIRCCDRIKNIEEFNRVLTGTGRHGVITELTCRIERGNKFQTVLYNDRKLFFKSEAFILDSQKLISNPGDCLFERGVWIDYPFGKTKIQIGQFSNYYKTAQNKYTRFRKTIAYGYLHMLGRWAGRLPKVIDILVKYLGILGIIISPRYGSVKDIESFTDKVLDSTVGDPTRMLIVLAPVESYAELFRSLYEICLDARKNHGAISFISFYVKAIKSDYLRIRNDSGKFAELMLYLGVRPEQMTNEILNEMVSSIDALCIKHEALRYMHTKTSKDRDILQKIDPNYLYKQN